MGVLYKAGSAASFHSVQLTHKVPLVESDFMVTKTSNTKIKHKNEPFF